ncbi:hypothetical protein GFS31_01870 [Leptolyngbya sp. BL0902]|nr:hypothetical protein GFS31_01870 [Leptolyngbya sp. BL0902]
MAALGHTPTLGHDLPSTFRETMTAAAIGNNLYHRLRLRGG